MKKCIYKNRLGTNGELMAKNFLSQKDLVFIKSNYRFERSEIDLIFEDTGKKIIIFVEVKTRKNENFGKPEESITPNKRLHIRKAAEGFISENEKYSDHDIRIDVVSIMLKNGKAEMDHFIDAF